MHAEPLGEYEVAYFTFDYPDCYSFWNKNVSFPLSLAFLDKNHKIVDFKDMEADDPKSVSPDSNNVVFIVEANKGLFKKLKIGIGDKLLLKGKKLILSKKT